MRLQYSPYSLVKRKKVNALDQAGTQSGVLLRILDSEGVWGVSDICPWPHLGDLSWEEELAQKGKLFQRALQLAEEDLQARQNKKSLLQDKWVDNNILVTDYTQFDFEAPKYQGKTLKIKGDKNIFRLIETLQAAPKHLIFRLDFNSILTGDEFQLFLDHISLSLPIEYIEDPCDYSEKLWSKWNRIVPLAADFVLAPAHYSIQVCKPSRQPVQMTQKTVLTSSMDHPVGVAHALRLAQKYDLPKSGLLTLDLYESTPFHDYFIFQNESEINFSQRAWGDTGIGMTEELQDLSWKELR